MSAYQFYKSNWWKLWPHYTKSEERYSYDEHGDYNKYYSHFYVLVRFNGIGIVQNEKEILHYCYRTI